MAYLLFVQLVIPLVFVASEWRLKAANRRDWWLQSLGMGAGTVFLFIVQAWIVTSAYLRWVWLIAFLVAAFISYRRIGAPGSGAAFGRAALIGNGLVAIFLSGMAILGVQGTWTPEGVIELSMPLAQGRYFVASGGNNLLVNNHAQAYTQTFAIDIVGLDGWGRSAAWGAVNPEEAAIFGAQIVSPCSGLVLAAVDDFADQAIGDTDTVNLAGNYVTLDCGEASVLLAHMQAGSVLVQEGQPVTVGQPLGRVGNTGNTSEPHLHMHAAVNSTQPNLLDGDPVPMLIDGRYLVRNNVFTGED